MVFMIVKSMQVVWSKAILKINPTTEEILKDVSSYVIVI